MVEDFGGEMWSSASLGDFDGVMLKSGMSENVWGTRMTFAR